MSPSINTQSGHTTSTETTTLALDPYKSSYMTQTELENTIQGLLYNSEAKHAKKLPTMMINMSNKMQSSRNLLRQSLQTKMRKLKRNTKTSYSPCNPKSKIFHPDRVNKTIKYLQSNHLMM